MQIMNMWMPADVSIMNLHTSATDIDWHGCASCEKERKKMLITLAASKSS